MKTMHTKDEHDDKLIAEEMALGAHTRAQMRAAEAAKATDIAIAADVQTVLPVITEEAETLQDDDDDNDDSSSEKLVSDPLLIPNLPFSIAPRRQPAKLRASMHVDIYDDLANHSEIAILKLQLLSVFYSTNQTNKQNLGTAY